MVEVTLTIYSLEDTKELPLTGDRFSIGRSSAADLMLNDEGLSRVHATIHREGDRVWILDEASTNGTCVNDGLVPPAGSPLADGDEISLGNHTTILINIRPVAVNNPYVPSDRPKTSISWPSPLLAASGGVVAVLLMAVIIGLATRKTNNNRNTLPPRVDQTSFSTPAPARTESNNVAAASPTSSPSPTVTPDVIAPSVTEPASAPVEVTEYRSMTQQQRFDYVAQEAKQVARMIGNREGFDLPPEVVTKIKAFVDTYSGRLSRKPPTGDGCTMRHDLRTLLTRASEHAPLIGKSFYDKGLTPQVGLYLAMIESEYCPCLSSGTGAKGMFQFVGTTARRYGVKDVSQPSTDRRFDDRCKVEIMAPLAAQYMKDLVAMFGTGPIGVPLAVASYNSGEGGLNKNLFSTLQSAGSSERSFWSLIANASHLSPQFQKENINYVPKFFAAAIVGENPRVFGVDMNPISTYNASTDSAAPSAP